MNTFLYKIQSLPEERRHLLVKVILIIAAIIIFFLLSLAITTGINNASKPTSLTQTTDTNTALNNTSPAEVGMFASLGGFKKFFINEDTISREQNGFSNLGRFTKELGIGIKNGGGKIIDYMIQHWFTKTIN